MGGQALGKEKEEGSFRGRDWGAGGIITDVTVSYHTKFGG